MQLQHETHIRDQNPRTQQVLVNGFYMVPRQTSYINTEYSADSRNRAPRARISLHIEKPKPHESVEDYTD